MQAGISVSGARDEPCCLFLDELNAWSAEVQKAFYSLNRGATVPFAARGQIFRVE
jgi:hypothetical protein